MITINEIEFEMEFEDQARFKNISNEISTFSKYTLPSLVEKHLAPIDWKNFRLEFNQIIIDIGSIRENNIQYELGSGIENELRRIAYKYKKQLVDKYDGAFRVLDKNFIKIDRIFKSESAPGTIQISRIIKVRQLTEKILQFEKIAKEINKEPSLRTQAFRTFKVKLSKLKQKIKSAKVAQKKIQESQATSLIKLIDDLDLNLEKFIKKETIESKISVQPTARLKGLQSTTPSFKAQRLSLSVGDNLKISDYSIAGYELLDYFFKRGIFPAISTVPDDKFEDFLLKSIHDLSPREIKFMLDNIDESELFLRLQNQLSEVKFQDQIMNKIIEFTPSVISENLKPRFGYLPLLDYLDSMLFDKNMPEWTTAFSTYSILDVINILFHKNPSLLQYFFHQQLSEGSKSAINKRIDIIFKKSKKAVISKVIYIMFSKSQKLIKILNAVNKLLDDSHLHPYPDVKKDLVAQYGFLLWLNEGNKLKSSDFGINIEEVFDHFKNKYQIQSDKTISEIIYKDPYKQKHLDRRKFKSAHDAQIEVKDDVLYFLRYGSVPYSKGQITIKDLNIKIKSLKDHDLFSKLTAYQAYHNKNLHLIDHKSFGELIIRSNIKGKDKLLEMYKNVMETEDISLSDLNQFLIYFASLGITISEDNFNSELGKYLLRKTQKGSDLKKVYVLRNEVGEIHVKNAGLVILWPHLRTYFSILEMLDEKGHFLNEELNERGVLLLQYLATKQSYAEEHYLPLNKVMVGYPFEKPVTNEIILTEKERDVSLALLKSIIKSWPGFESSSTDSLRGGFFIRDGILSKVGTNWSLSVEKKAYDILLDKLPWGFGKIKMPWNDFFIDVEWK